MSKESQLITLRSWNVDDAPALFKYAGEPRVSALALWPTHTSEDMSRWVIENIFIPNPHSYAIVLNETLEPIGAIGLVPEGEEHFEPNPGEREVGYWIGLPYWSRGLATEALRIFMHNCQQELHLRSLLLTTDAANRASQRVAEKCGFTPIGDYIFDGIDSKAYRYTFKV